MAAETVVTTPTTYTNSKGTEIAVGAIIRADGSKIDRSVTNIYLICGSSYIVADRLDHKGYGRNFRAYLGGEDVTVVSR